MHGKGLLMLPLRKSSCSLLDDKYAVKVSHHYAENTLPQCASNPKSPTINGSQLPSEISTGPNSGPWQKPSSADLLLRNRKLIEIINTVLIIKAQVLRWHFCMSEPVSDAHVLNVWPAVWLKCVREQGREGIIKIEKSESVLCLLSLLTNMLARCLSKTHHRERRCHSGEQTQNPSAASLPRRGRVWTNVTQR